MTTLRVIVMRVVAAFGEFTCVAELRIADTQRIAKQSTAADHGRQPMPAERAKARLRFA
jgi:hypothetical protein